MLPVFWLDRNPDRDPSQNLPFPWSELVWSGHADRINIRITRDIFAAGDTNTGGLLSRLKFDLISHFDIISFDNNE